MRQAVSLIPPSLSAAARKDLAENIREEGERLDRYVQNLLDMTRIGHGALKLHMAPLDVGELIGTARHRLRAPLRAHQVTADVPDSLPLVFADEVLLEQVLVNILDNAAKYAPAGSNRRPYGRPTGRGWNCRSPTLAPVFRLPKRPCVRHVLPRHRRRSSARRDRAWPCNL